MSIFKLFSSMLIITVLECQRDLKYVIISTIKIKIKYNSANGKGN